MHPSVKFAMGRDSHSSWVCLEASLLVAIVTACGGATPNRSDTVETASQMVLSGAGGDKSFHGVEPTQPFVMPDITLTTDNGRPFNLIEDTAYRVTLVFFGYTHCPTACPVTLATMATALRQLPNAVRVQTQFLFINIDPARDSPGVIRAYLDRFSHRFVGLTGRPAAIRQAAHKMGVAIAGVSRLRDGGYELGHGAQVIGFAGNTAPVLWTAGTPAETIDYDVTKLASQ